MADIAEKTRIMKGGEFLISDSADKGVFIPEELTDEQRAMGDMAREFLVQHIWPNIQRIDKQEAGLSVQLLDKAGELGLLCAAIPEEYGGLGIDIITESVLSNSFTVSSLCVTSSVFLDVAIRQ